MNRQNNLKIIISTVIVLVISAIAVFTVVNWAEIVKKFQNAASKADGIEKHERNTVPPSNSQPVVINNAPEESKDTASSKEETKLTPNFPTDPNTKILPKHEDTTKSNPKLKEIDPYGLDEPPTLKPRDYSSTYNFKDNDEYPIGKKDSLDKKNILAPEKSIRMSKRHHAKKHPRRHRTKRTHYAKGKIKNLDKRVNFLEKKLGITKTDPDKKSNLETRIYRLEKLIIQKKK